MPITPQAAALVYRRPPGGGAVECVIVTANSGGWTIPKGLIDPGKSPRQMAEIEALEEAGVIGKAEVEPIGRYSYEKWGGRCEVEVFLVPLDRELDRWAEQATRERRWATLEEAAGLMKYDTLASLLREVGARFARGERL
ncbi:MAG: NUDIX domain-containing protein [Phycisphaerales bacterium]|nr:MAG: NUDIX domain-containing protein [Phycisphaerales bacterium]